MPKLKRIIIAGSSGEIGKRLLENLIAHNQIGEIHLLLRTPLNISNPRVHEHLVDFDSLHKLEIKNPNQLETLAYCTLGSTIKKAGSKQAFSKIDLDYVVNFGHWVQSQHAKQMAVISSIDANKNSNTFYLKTKGDMEQALSNMNWDRLWILRPSLLTGKRKEFRLGETLGAYAAKLITSLLVGPYRKYRPINMNTVATALTSLLETYDQGITILESNDIERLGETSKSRHLLK